MIPLTPSPYLRSDLLADVKGTPSALMLGFPADNPESLLALLDSEDFRSLSGQMPCLVQAGAAVLANEELAAALDTTRCIVVEPGALLAVEEALPPALPPGAQWVGGRWYLQPPAKPSTAQAASRTLALQMVQLVLADADTHEIEALFRRDPALSYHLLRLVNSLGVGMGKKIASFSQAIVILGRQQLRRWLNLMLFSAREGDHRSPMLLARVAVRARRVELLAKACGLDRSTQELAFMAGMFSLLGVLFGQPLDEVLKPLKISDALRDAVLENEGDLGHLLALVVASENGQEEVLAGLLDEIQIAPADFNAMTIQAYAWMLNVVRDSQGPSNG